MVILRQELVRACVICVNMAFHFVLVQLGTECVPNMLQARSIVSSAVHETDCPHLDYELAFPNVSILETELDDETTTTTKAARTSRRALPMDHLSRCERCVKRGLKYMTTDAGSLCLSDYGEIDDNVVKQRAGTPQECQLREWIMVTTGAPTTTELPTTALAESGERMTATVVTIYVLIGVMIAVGLIGAGLLYIHKFVKPRRVRGDDNRHHFQNVMYNPNAEEGEELIEMGV